MNIYKSIVLFFVCIGSIAAQQSPQYSLAQFNKYSFNPAYAGLDFSLSATAAYRNQWEGIPGSPRNVHLNAHMPFYLWSGALGAIVESRSIGGISTSKFGGSYNYVLNSPLGLISFGGRVGLQQLSLDGTNVITPEGVYVGGNFNHNDPVLVENVDEGVSAFYDVGVYFVNKTFEAGLSIAEFPQTSIALERTNFLKDKYFTLFTQYNYNFSEEILLMPSILLKTNLEQFQTDFSLVSQINGSIFGGISLRGYSPRSFDSLVFMFGMKLSKHYTLHYSYDFGVSGLRSSNDGTHEVLLNYNLQRLIGTGMPPKIIYNPRFL